MFRQIMIPVTFDQLEIPSRALQLAALLDAELHVLHIVLDEKLSRAQHRQRLAHATRAVEALPESAANVTIHRQVCSGPVSDAILEYCQQAAVDLVYLDQRHSGTATLTVFSAIAQRLVGSLPCHVLIATDQAEEQCESHTLQALAEQLREALGTTVCGDQQETRARLLEAIAQSSADAETTAEDAATWLQRLEASGAVQWHPESTADGSGEKDGKVATDRKGETVSAAVNERVSWDDLQAQDVPAEASDRGRWVLLPEPEAGLSFEAMDDDTQLNQSAAVGLLRHAIAARATDIHIDPSEAGNYLVRFRIDGRIQEYCTMQRDVAGAVMKQIKVLADVSLSDPFHPTESRLHVPASVPGHAVRLTTAPVVHGQAMALRLIDRDKLYRPLNELGLSSDAFAAVYQMLHDRSGLVLITGPTGAGKTTTAYSMLNILFSEKQNIVSIEDPVELTVPFMRQLNVDQRRGLTMQVALATVLRMDPDVLFVGEIRSSEAAQVAIQASGCGKRSFSTMHMRDVSAAITAMRKFGIDAKTLADNVSGIITQRLVRRVCPTCSESGPPTKYEQELFARHGMEPPQAVPRARGCEACRGTGYQHRIGIFEAIAVDEHLADAIRQDTSEAELRQHIRDLGTASLLQDGLRKVRDGVTTAEELQEMNWLSPQQSAATHRPPSMEHLYERGAPFKK